MSQTLPTTETLTRLPATTDEVVLGQVSVITVPTEAPARVRRHQRLAGRFRRLVLWTLAFFLIFQLGLALAIEWKLPVFRDPYYAHKANRLEAQLNQTPAPPRSVVMLGSSRTVFALRGHEVEKMLGDGTVVFNFGIPGGGPLTELLCLRRLLAQGVRPDHLLLEVLPPVFAGQASIAEVTRLDVQRMWWDDLPVIERHVHLQENLRASWCEGWVLPAVSHRYAIMSQVAPALLTQESRLDWFNKADASGWVPPADPTRTPERIRFATERTRREYGHYLDGFQLGGSSVSAMRELLDLCRQEGIPVTLILMPESSEFRSWYTPECWAQVEKYLAELQSEYAIPLVNARQWVADDAFVDGHHIYEDGATCFSERLGREVIGPMLDKNQARAAR
jgi:hypothetical protein